MGHTIPNNIKKARRRTPNENSSNYVNYIHIVSCPKIDSIDGEMFPQGSHFDRNSFAASMEDGSFPNGMIVLVFAKKPTTKQEQIERDDLERWVKCMVYQVKGEPPYLHECAPDGSLNEEGLCFKSNGKTSPTLVIFNYES